MEIRGWGIRDGKLEDGVIKDRDLEDDELEGGELEDGVLGDRELEVGGRGSAIESLSAYKCPLTDGFEIAIYRNDSVLSYVRCVQSTRRATYTLNINFIFRHKMIK